MLGRVTLQKKNKAAEQKNSNPACYKTRNKLSVRERARELQIQFPPSTPPFYLFLMRKLCFSQQCGITPVTHICLPTIPRGHMHERPQVTTAEKLLI